MKILEIPFRAIFLLIAVAFLFSGCNGSPVIVKPSRIVWEQPEVPVSRDPSAGKAETVSSRDTVLRVVQSQIGRPYRWGGRTPAIGFDCSGLVQYSHSQAGISVPRMSMRQLSQAKRVSLQNLQPGDLVFFRIRSNVSHVGIYIGDGQFVHAPSRGKRVSRERLKKNYWQTRLYAAGNYY